MCAVVLSTREIDNGWCSCVLCLFFVGCPGLLYCVKYEKCAECFMNAPYDGEGRAFSQGWGELLAISSSPLVLYGPADRRGVGTRGVSGVCRTGTFLSIYLSIYPSMCVSLYLSIYLSTYVFLTPISFFIDLIFYIYFLSISSFSIFS